MRVFVTGASGFLGSAIVRELLGAAHEVTGLVRSKASAEALEATGARAVLGDIERLDILRQGASNADGVIHTAFYHQISHIPFATRLKVMLGGLPSGIVGRFMQASLDADRNAIETMAAALRRSGGPLVTSFPTMSLQPGVLGTEDQLPSKTSPGALRGTSEAVVRRLAKDVRATIVRLPPLVHGEGDRNGLLPQLIKTAKKNKESGYIGSGDNRWGAVHKLDAAHLFRLALERGTAGSAYHAVAEEGIAFKQIAEALAFQLNLSAVSKSTSDLKQFGFLSSFVAADNPVSSQQTQTALGWRFAQPGLLESLPPTYFQQSGDR